MSSMLFFFVMSARFLVNAKVTRSPIVMTASVDNLCACCWFREGRGGSRKNQPRVLPSSISLCCYSVRNSAVCHCSTGRPTTSGQCCCCFSGGFEILRYRFLWLSFLPPPTQSTSYLFLVKVCRCLSCIPRLLPLLLHLNNRQNSKVSV